MPGTQFVLRTDRLGSIGRGAPVYYHNIAVGQVLGYELAEDKQDLTVKVFVDAPHDQLVRPDSRFWNASGVDVSLGADGVEVSMESLAGAARRRHRLRHAGHRPAGRAGRRRHRLSAVRQPARR